MGPLYFLIFCFLSIVLFMVFICWLAFMADEAEKDKYKNMQPLVGDIFVGTSQDFWNVEIPKQDARTIYAHESNNFKILAYKISNELNGFLNQSGFVEVIDKRDNSIFVAYMLGKKRYDFWRVDEPHTVYICQIIPYPQENKAKIYVYGPCVYYLKPQPDLYLHESCDWKGKRYRAHWLPMPIKGFIINGRIEFNEEEMQWIDTLTFWQKTNYDRRGSWEDKRQKFYLPPFPIHQV